MALDTYICSFIECYLPSAHRNYLKYLRVFCILLIPCIGVRDLEPDLVCVLAFLLTGESLDFLSVKLVQLCLIHRVIMNGKCGECLHTAQPISK